MLDSICTCAVDFSPRRYNTLPMSATSKKAHTRRRASSRSAEPRVPREHDPRVVRSRAAVVDAARTLFLRTGYAGTTMQEIAALAGLTKRTVYNNYGGTDALFREIVADVLACAAASARGLHEEFTV